jgi:hypothetical protein
MEMLQRLDMSQYIKNVPNVTAIDLYKIKAILNEQQLNILPLNTAARTEFL